MIDSTEVPIYLLVANQSSEKKMSDRSSKRAFRNSVGDWFLRVLIAAVFIFFGAQKFPSRPDAPWVVFFNQVGVGQWLRYFTALVEIAGGVLVLIPELVNVGLVVLGATLIGGGLADIIAIRHPADALVPFALICALLAFWIHRGRVRRRFHLSEGV